MQKELSHLAIIMDGNRRWAKENGLSVNEGHKEGIKAAFRVAKGCINENIPYLTLFCFSKENWKRDEGEVNFIFSSLSRINDYIDDLNKNGIKVLLLGDISSLEDSLITSLNEVKDKTKENNILNLQIAINYSGLWEISNAINRALKEGVTHFDESTLFSFLDNPTVPNPDFIVRSSNDLRLSGFLTLSSSYSELAFYDKYWPMWDESMVKIIKKDYYKRNRNFGV